MDKSFTRITKNKSLTPLLIFFSFALAALSGYCFALPFIKNIEAPLKYAFVVAGAVGAMYFTFMTFNCGYQLVKPKNAVLVSDEGFLDLVNGGVGAGFIPWSNVRCIEMCGGSKPYIGIGLSDANVVLKTANRALEKQIGERSGDEKPELMFRPFEIGCSLAQAYETLKNHRNAYLRSLDHGDTNVLYGDNYKPAARVRPPKGGLNAGVNAGVNTGVNAVEALNSSLTDQNEKLPDTDEAVSPTARSEAKSVDELLAELSASLGKSRGKLDGGEISAELEQFINKLQNKNKTDGKKQ